MKRLVAFFLVLAFSMPAGAVESGQVMYVGGTVPNLKDGAIGTLRTTSQTVLEFGSAGGTLAIPYAKIDSFECSQEVARHLGVLPAIAVGLVKKRQRRHFFRITFRDENGVVQVAVFEVPKQMPRSLLAILQIRAAQACKTAACRAQ